MNRYLLDTNVFIQAQNQHYRFDFCPAFWDWIDGQNAVGKVASIEQVAAELKEVEDEVSQWVSQREKSFFIDAGERAIVEAQEEVGEWASALSGVQRYEQEVVDKFLGGADPWLIAHAKAHGWVVVTHEASAPRAKKSIKIPDVCEHFQVRCINPFQMLSEAGARFVLDLANGV